MNTKSNKLFTYLQEKIMKGIGVLFFLLYSTAAFAGENEKWETATFKHSYSEQRNRIVFTYYPGGSKPSTSEEEKSNGTRLQESWLVTTQITVQNDGGVISLVAKKDSLHTIQGELTISAAAFNGCEKCTFSEGNVHIKKNDESGASYDIDFYIKLVKPNGQSMTLIGSGSFKATRVFCDHAVTRVVHDTMRGAKLEDMPDYCKRFLKIPSS